MDIRDMDDRLDENAGDGRVLEAGGRPAPSRPDPAPPPIDDPAPEPAPREEPPSDDPAPEPAPREEPPSDDPEPTPDPPPMIA